VPGNPACVFFGQSPVYIGRMSATACFFGITMADESAEIARGLRQRDPDLLDGLIEQYQHRLLRYLIHLTGRREQAEDLFQETWIRVLERGSQYDGRHDFITWLFTIARNLAIDYSRRRQLDPAEDIGLPETSAPSAFDLTARREQGERIDAGMQHLPAEYREALALRFQEDMPLEEIARVIGAPLGTVKSRIYRGLAALEPWLKEEAL